MHKTEDTKLGVGCYLFEGKMHVMWLSTVHTCDILNHCLQLLFITTQYSAKSLFAHPIDLGLGD